MSADRQTGRTTQQLKQAPQGALYIVGQHMERNYTRRLAHDLGRNDLSIESASFISAGRLFGTNIHGRFSAVVVDHAAYLSTEQRHCLDAIESAGMKVCR